MTKTSFLYAAAGLLALAAVAAAQPPGITPEMIARALPLEGAPLAEPGPYEVTTGPAFGSPGLMVFHPAKLDAFPKKDTLPVVVWGNGGCAIDTTRYGGFLSTIVWSAASTFATRRTGVGAMACMHRVARSSGSPTNITSHG